MLKKLDGQWRGETWEELGIEFKGSQEFSAGNVKVTCPACVELGKTKINDTCLSVKPSEGVANCHKCGTVFLIEKKERVEKFESKPLRFKAVPRPKNLTAISDDGVTYFRNRRIPQELITKFKIGETLFQRDDGPTKFVAFPYMRKGTVVNIKYKGIKEKEFSQAGGGSHIVFNYDSALSAVETQGSVIITEGEEDCMSFDLAGYASSVSLDSGAPNPQDRNLEGKFACIDNSLELFDKAKLIYIAVDNDQNGRIAEKELVRRFGTEKVRLIDFGNYKDANELLMYDGVEGLKKVFQAAKEPKVSGIFRMEDALNEVMDMITNGLTKGTSTYMPSIDKAWKWRVGEVNLWSGYNNEGKSTLLRYLEMIKAKFDGWRFGLFIPEDMPLAEFMESMIHMYVGKPTDPDNPLGLPRANEKEIKEAVAFIQQHFFVVYPEDGFTLDNLFEKFRYLIRRHGVRVVDIDPYNQVEHMYGKAMREDLYISEFMSKAKRFAVQNGVAFNIVAHQIKPDRPRDGRLDFDAPTKYNIKGGGTFSDKADNVLVCYRPRRRSDPKDRTTTFISEKIKKPKLVGEVDLHVDITYDYFRNRYLDIELGNKSPLEVEREKVDGYT